MGYKERGVQQSRKSGADTKGSTVARIIEAAEVIEVILDESHSEFAPELNRDVGAVLARRLHSEFNKPISTLRWYKPLNIHSNVTPVVGEYVLLIEAPASSFGVGRKLTDMYYISAINLFGETKANHNHFSSIIVGSMGVNTDFVGNIAASSTDPEIGEYATDDLVPRLNLFEGDNLIKSRYGSGIRLGSTAAGSKTTHLWEGGEEGAPIVIMSNGHAGEGDYYTEDINEDASTIMLTSTQEVGITVENSMPKEVSDAPPQFNKGQVILCADRLLFTSKTDYVIVSGGKGLALVTPEWKADFSAMMDILKDLIADVEKLSQGTFPTGVGPTGPHPSVPGTIAQVKSKWGQLEQ